MRRLAGSSSGGSATTLPGETRSFPRPSRRSPSSSRQTTTVVVCLLEDGDRLLGRGNDLVSPGSVVAEPPDEEPAKRRMGGERRVPELVRGLCRLVEKDFGPSELTDLGHSFGKVGEELESRGIPFRKQPVGAPKQVGGGPHVAACKRATSRGGESGRSTPPELEAVIVEGP